MASGSGIVSVIGIIVVLIVGAAASFYGALSPLMVGGILFVLFVFWYIGRTSGIEPTSSDSKESRPSQGFLSDLLSGEGGTDSRSSPQGSRSSVQTPSNTTRGSRDQDSNSNLNRAPQNKSMPDQVENTAKEILNDIKDEEKLDQMEEKDLKDAENRLKDFLRRYERDKDQIHALEEKLNGNISEAEYLDIMSQTRQGGSMQNAYKQLMQDLEKMKEDLEKIINDLEEIEGMEQEELKESKQAESDAVSILQNEHFDKLEAAIQQLNS